MTKSEAKLVVEGAAAPGGGPLPDYALVPGGGPLPDYYSAVDNGDRWLLRCKKCAKGYNVLKVSKHPGNKIALMNHVRTHSELEEL